MKFIQEYPHTPHHYNAQGRAVFTTSQMEWGDPKDDFGFMDEYEVVEEEHSSHPFALNYADELLLIKPRPVHRYCRIERFKSVLTQLMGSTSFRFDKNDYRHGNILPQRIKDCIPKNIIYTPKSQIWETIRQALKANNNQIYYNRIPSIAAALKLVNYTGQVRGSIFKNIMSDFKLMHYAFPKIQHIIKRKYFPNLRFVALTLLKKYNVNHPIDIPLTRTKNKAHELQLIFNEIWSVIWDEEIDKAFLLNDLA